MVVIGTDQRIRDSGPQLMTDGVELLRPVHRDDADITVRILKHEVVAHRYSPS